MSDLVERLKTIMVLMTTEDWHIQHKRAIHDAIAFIEAQGPRLPVSSIDYQQQRGVAWDIIDEAISTYDGWMLDDDYQAGRVLSEVMTRMRQRRDAHKESVLPTPATDDTEVKRLPSAAFSCLSQIADDGFRTEMKGRLQRAWECWPASKSEFIAYARQSCGLAPEAKPEADDMSDAEITARQEGQDYRYARQLLETIARKHFGDCPKVQPLPTLSGVLTQIDHLTASMVRDHRDAPAKPEREALVEWYDHVFEFGGRVTKQHLRIVLSRVERELLDIQRKLDERGA